MDLFKICRVELFTNIQFDLITKVHTKSWLSHYKDTHISEKIETAKFWDISNLSLKVQYWRSAFSNRNLQQIWKKVSEFVKQPNNAKAHTKARLTNFLDSYFNAIRQRKFSTDCLSHTHTPAITHSKEKWEEN